MILVGTFTGIVLQIPVRAWTMDGRRSLKSSLPKDFLDLFEDENIIFVGNEVKRDILQSLGIDIGDRFLETQVLFDGMICRGALSHFDDERPRTSLMAQQLSMFGWERVTKTFARYFDAGGSIRSSTWLKSSWQKTIWTYKNDELIFGPFPEVNERQAFRLRHFCLI